MRAGYWYGSIALMWVGYSSAVQATEYPDGESLQCYQNGQLIFETSERMRAFQPSGAMTPLADVSVGQVQERHHKLYASDKAGVVCIVTDEK